MKIRSIYPGAIVRRALASPSAPPLQVGDEVGQHEALRIENAPAWPQRAVEYEAEPGVGDGRIGSMVIG